ncbi:MAG: class I SAM-dependent RNA methyltransferase [Opitutaceae bacterium]
MAKKRFNDHPFPYHAEFELEISTLTNLGVGLGRVEIAECGTRIAESAKPAGSATRGEKSQTPPANPKSDIRNVEDSSAGTTQPLTAARAAHAPETENPKPETAAGGGRWVVMVPFALPGERVRVRVFRNHKNYSEADLVAVVRAAPERITPRCPLFGTCGGCQYQNLSYAEQLRWKQRHVAELLRHMARTEFPVNPVIPSPREFGYRSKITPHFEAPRAAETSNADFHTSNPVAPETRDIKPETAAPFPIGFLRAASRFALIDVPQCPIATDAINAALPAARAEIRAKAAAGTYKRGATVLLRHSLEGVTSDYEATITEAVEGLKLRFLARDFFQNNPFILPAFTGYVREQAAASGARFLVDAYCGSGLFALTAARRFERVAGVEISESSVRWATENAAANGVANARFLAADAGTIFAGLDFPAAGTAVVIDPPRRGCDELFLRQLVSYGPRTIVYVSCDPATQMRDLALLQPAGYELTAVQPFDLFPQTRHLECVITLRKT